MYKHLNKSDIQKLLKLPEDYSVDALLVMGTHHKPKEYPHLYEALEKLNLIFTEETIQDEFFGDIKSLLINGKRIWFDVAYGTAYLSEVAHIASMLGSKANIILGTCGGLQTDLNTGDTIIPSSSYGNESSTRMYERDNQAFVYKSDINLRNKLKESLAHREVINEGDLMTVQAMLAETKEDVENWSKHAYVGVDMESATLFAVSNHFNVPCAALLYVADNLIKNELIDNPAYSALAAQRMSIKKENYKIALKTLLS